MVMKIPHMTAHIYMRSYTVMSAYDLIYNNNGCGLFMTPVECSATSTIDLFLATTRTLSSCRPESAVSLSCT